MGPDLEPPPKSSDRILPRHLSLELCRSPEVGPNAGPCDRPCVHSDRLPTAAPAPFTKAPHLIANTVDFAEFENSSGQARQFLEQIADAITLAHDQGIQQAHERIQQIIKDIQALCVKEYFHSSRMMYARFREMPDGTVLVVSDHGLWFHQNDPEVVQRFHQMVEQERKYIADNPPSSASLGDDIDNVIGCIAG